jgi:hypothetical protein
MRVSELFDLDSNQAALDFVDVDVTTDVPVFIDPRAIRIQKGHWHDSCVGLLQTFFHEILMGISEGNLAKVLILLNHLSEPNETHLGVSVGRSRGRGLGGVGARRIVESLAQSKAAQTKMLRDLEDSALLIENIGRDIISDITTNVIRGALIGYTQHVCIQHDIPLQSNLYAGWVWNEDTLEWEHAYADLPEANDSILLLVPKSIVRINLIYEPSKYYRRAIAPIHEQLEIDAGSSLVYALKNGERRVNRGGLINKYGSGKSDVVRHTQQHPQALRVYRETPGLAETPPIDHETLAEKTNSPYPNFGEMLASVRAIAPGKAGASHYHRAVKDFLVAIFYPFLANVQIEKPIHDGRKRLDINFDNIATRGFFRWISLHNMASQIVVECKNYSGDPANPELDQLGGRFGTHRTRFGILVCRQIEKKALFADRCRDTAKDDRGFIFFLDDDDLHELTKHYDPHRGEYLLLRDQFDRMTG